MSHSAISRALRPVEVDAGPLVGEFHDSLRAKSSDLRGVLSEQQRRESDDDLLDDEFSAGQQIGFSPSGNAAVGGDLDEQERLDAGPPVRTLRRRNEKCLNPVDLHHCARRP